MSRNPRILLTMLITIWLLVAVAALVWQAAALLIKPTKGEPWRHIPVVLTAAGFNLLTSIGAYNLYLPGVNTSTGATELTLYATEWGVGVGMVFFGCLILNIAQLTTLASAEERVV